LIGRGYFLSLEAVARALPKDWRELREWLQEWPAGDTASELVRGGYLDSEQRYYLVWLHQNLDQLALVFDRQGHGNISRSSLARGPRFARCWR